MDVVSPLVADGEATELGEPREGPLDDPPVPSQPLAALDRELDRTRMERDVFKIAIGIFAEMPE